MTYLRIMVRGFVIVFLTAANVVQVAGGHLIGAGIGGFLISAVWWSNSHAAKENPPYASVAYGFGAAVGTITGAGLTSWWYG